MAEWVYAGITWKEFCDKGLNKPGTLIHADDGMRIIGDINECGGTCGCCNFDYPDTKIVRYMVLAKLLRFDDSKRRRPPKGGYDLVQLGDQTYESLILQDGTAVKAIVYKDSHE